MENKSLGIDALGREACLITLKNASGMSVTLTNFGARLVSVMAPDRDGNIADVCLGFDSLADYETRSGYLGATIGRWGNRIANASFELNGKTYALYANNGKNTLHGGQKGFDKKFWEYSAKGAQGLLFHYTSPDGEEGFPGNLNTTVSFTLEDDGSLVISYEAGSDRDTVVNLTNHAYWNLAGQGAKDCLDHRLTIHADRFLPVDDTLIPLGELRAFFGRRSGKRLHSRQNVLYRDVLPTLEIRLDAAFDPATSQPVLGANARKKYFLNPVPDGFYDGNTDTHPDLDGDGLTTLAFRGGSFDESPVLDPRFATWWPDNTMGIDFYRSLPRKHPF
ncbi:MAG TPA: aldose epimerase family protein, partial [Clostridia bacterium]|nr:aldose epimerase family protein [Clostridia bacterium]